MNEKFVTAFLDEIQKLAYVESQPGEPQYAATLRAAGVKRPIQKGEASRTALGQAIMRRASRPPGARRTQIFKRPTQTT